MGSLQFMINEKDTKQYLKQKIQPTTILALILLGFFTGSGMGKILFQDSKENVIQFTMVYSSEKDSWVKETATLFKEYWAEKQAHNSSIKDITLDFQPYGSGGSLIALLNGETKPIVWSPASNLWIPLLNTKWTEYTGKTELIVPEFTRLIYSPVVIATWEKFYDEHPFESMNDLHNIIQENPGLVKMAHTDPRSSNSGFMATIMMVSSKLNMDPTLMTVDNLTNPDLEKWMREFESSAIFYGSSTGFLGRYMKDNGPDELQITILYENLVQDYCLEAEEAFGQKMVSVYPTEGSLFSDHPFCILNADWVSAEQKYVAEEYLDFISRKENIAKAIETGFRPINSSILEDIDIQQIYNQSFNEDHGVTNDPSIIIELETPTDGKVIERIPDLWLLTRNQE